MTNSEAEHAHSTRTGVTTDLSPKTPTLTAEYAFPVLEEHKGTAGPKDVKVTLPNKARLTPLSIMVCDTISAVRSGTLLKVLLDSRSTAMFVPRKSLPVHCKPYPVTKTDSVNMLAGLCIDNQMVVLRAIQLPELDRNESLSSITHLCSMVILGPALTSYKERH